MSSWTNRAYSLLSVSLGEPKHELNELDWKADLSQKGTRVAEHVCAFANFPGGGYFAFGVSNAGEVTGVTQEQVELILSKLSNIGREAVEPKLTVNHAVVQFMDRDVLLLQVEESATKPVRLRGKSLEETFIRSGGTTRRASLQEVGNLLLNSRTPRWEDLTASTLLPAEEILKALDFGPIFEALGRTPPSSASDILSWAAGERFIKPDVSGGYYITNLGAIAAAHKLDSFPGLDRKGIRVVIYNGTDRLQLKMEKEGARGYAVGFKGLLDFVVSQLPQSEVIQRAFRVKKTVYPELALRELIANALIHQDFTIKGSGPLVEIFKDRIVISNPGTLLPSKRLDRLIGTQPESRNEALAKAFRRYKICEELGSGLIKAGSEAELYGLPPIKFDMGDNFFRVTLFSPRSYAEMSSSERLSACYQHAVLKYCANETMTNKSLRERLKMPERHRSTVSVLIQQAIDHQLIKAADPDNISKKFTEYVPIWA